MATTIGSVGIEALSKIRTYRTTLADMAVGLLYGIDTNGKMVPAAASTNIKAVGILTEGSGYLEGAAREFNKANVLRAGKGTNVEKFAILNVAYDTYTELQIGNVVYLGEAGLFTLTPTTTEAETLQKVGQVYSRASVQINLTIDSAGTLVPAVI